jgi:hypothetical protein
MGLELYESIGLQRKRGWKRTRTGRVGGGCRGGGGRGEEEEEEEDVEDEEEEEEEEEVEGSQCAWQDCWCVLPVHRGSEDRGRGRIREKVQGHLAN